MPIPQWPFTTLAVPLTNRINELSRPLHNELRKLKTLADLDSFIATRRDDLLREVTPIAPRLGDSRVAAIRDPVTTKLPNGSRRVLTRHYFAVEVEGDALSVGYWPDDSSGLIPVNDPRWEPSSLTVEDELDLWEFGFDDDAPGEVQLYTYFALTPAEEAAVHGGTLNLPGMFQQRLERIRPIVARIHDEIEEAFANKIPTHLDKFLDQKRREFTAREGVSATFNFPEKWKAPPPGLEVPAVLQKSSPSTVSVPHIPRLSSTTFEDVQRTIRVWANSMERYPRAFAGLGEDPISDLLAATLNATLPAAHREVYSRGGKSDIFIKADVLGEGAGPEKIFIAESKWATSGAVVREALDPQLFGYLTAEDTSAVLLLLLHQKDKATVVSRYLDELREVAGYTRQEDSAVAGWPVLVFENKHRVVRVCVAMVHLPH